MPRYSRDEMAARVARDIPEGAYVNLGIELPTCFHHADSFAMMRGGHLDFCVLGAFQVSAQGDLANWHTGAPDAIPAVDGAMDLAIGAKKVCVMEHLTEEGESKIVARCTYPLTGIRCVHRIFTDLAVLDVTPDGLAVVEFVGGLSLDELMQLTGVPLRHASAH